MGCELRRVYATREHAEKAILGHIPLFAYECPRGCGYHLTRQDPKTYVHGPIRQLRNKLKRAIGRSEFRFLVWSLCLRLTRLQRARILGRDL